MLNLNIDADIVGKLVDSVGSNDILFWLLIVMSIVLIVFIALNYQKTMSFLDERKKVRVSNLNDAIQSGYLKGLTEEFFKKEIETEYFKVISGIRVEEPLREAMIKAHKEANGRLGFHNYIHAEPHSFYIDSKLKIKITRLDYISYWFNSIIGFFMILGALGIFMFSMLLATRLSNEIANISSLQMLFFVAMGFVYFALGRSMLSDTSSLRSAKKVREELEKGAKIGNKVSHVD